MLIEIRLVQFHFLGVLCDLVISHSGRRWRVTRCGGLFIRNPGNKQAGPVFGGLGDLHADARGAVNSWREPYHRGGGFGRGTVGPVSADVQILSNAHFLVEMKQGARRGNIISLSGLTPGRAVFRAS